jgi:hypothetical protein
MIAPGQEYTIYFRVDTLETVAAAAGTTLIASLDSMDGSAKAPVNFANGTSDGLYFLETINDTAITDITPTTITYDTLTYQTAKLDVVAKSQSASKTAVIGVDDVRVLDFELEAGSASDLKIDTVTITGLFDANGGAVDNGDAASGISETYVDEVTIYHTSISPENVVDSRSGSKFAAGDLVFDFDNLLIEADQTMDFYVVADFANNTNVAADTVRFAVDEI